MASYVCLQCGQERSGDDLDNLEWKYGKFGSLSCCGKIMLPKRESPPDEDEAEKMRGFPV